MTTRTAMFLSHRYMNSPRKTGGFSSKTFLRTSLRLTLKRVPTNTSRLRSDRGCDQAPPPKGEFLELPTGGHFTVEHANNQAFTTLSYDGSETTRWPDGGHHPRNWHGQWDGAECLPGGGYMHATNRSNAQGTAFAIAYESDLSKITMRDLVVFSVLKQYASSLNESLSKLTG